MGKTEKKEVTAKSITNQLKEVEEKNKKAMSSNDKRLYTRFKKQIDTAYKKMETCYLDTATAIHSIYSKELYKIDNFKNIYDFAKENYNISRGTCSKFINICAKFGVMNENGTVTGLQERFQAYGVSQLGVMLSFPDVLLNQCTPEMSVRDLKQLGEDFKHSLDSQRDAIDSASDSVVDSETMNLPDDTDAETDAEMEVLSKNTFVCQATTMEELLSLQKVVKESFEDVLSNNEIAQSIYKNSNFEITKLRMECSLNE